MSEPTALEPEIERPDLPSDRAAATASLATLKDRSTDVDAMARASGIDWAPRLMRRKYRGGDVDAILDAIERAAKSLREGERHLGIVNPHGESTGSPEAALPVLIELSDLTEDHISAAISAQFGDIPPERLQSLIADIKHLLHLQTVVKEAIETDIPSNEANKAIRDAAAAADALRQEFDCETLETAAARGAALEADGPAIERKVRRLTVLAARLDMPDISIGELESIARACAHATSLPRELLGRIGEIGPELGPVVTSAKEKAKRIANAGELLDGRIGKAWRAEAMDTLVKARDMAEIAGHPSHAKIGAYARGIGISSGIVATLDAIVKTRSGQAAFESGALKRAIPRSFKGLDTDFEAIERAVEARGVLERMLKGVLNSDRVLAAIGSSHSLVVDEFLAFAELVEDASTLPFDRTTPLRRVRMMHDDRVRRLAALGVAVENLPVAKELRTPSDARRLGRLVREIDATRERIDAMPDRASLGARTDEEIVKAHGWRGRLFEILPDGSRPAGDSGFAQLHVHAREAVGSCKDAIGAIGTLASLLPAEAVPTPASSFRDAMAMVETIRAAEPVLHAQVLVCEAMDAVMRGGLEAFVHRMAREGVPSSAWMERLQEEYATLDRLDEDTAFASRLARAADEAGAPEATPTLIPAAPAIAPIEEIGGWVEEQVSFKGMPAMSIERTVDLDEGLRQVAE